MEKLCYMDITAQIIEYRKARFQSWRAWNTSYSIFSQNSFVKALNTNVTWIIFSLVEEGLGCSQLLSKPYKSYRTATVAGQHSLFFSSFKLKVEIVSV